MGRLRDLVSFVIRPFASSSGGRGDRWITVGGCDETSVDEKSALAISTYYACIRNIAEDTAKLPFTLIQNDGKKRIRLDADPLTMLFAVNPNPWMTAYTFKCLMFHWAAGWGNAYAEILRNGGGKVAQLNPIHPSRVFVEKYASGNYIYKVCNDDGTQTPMLPDRMFHFMGMSGDGRTGYSVLKLMQNTLTIAEVVQRFAKNFYQNSARPAGVLETDSILKPEARKNLATSWTSMYSGPMNAGKTAVLEAGVKYKTLSIPMKDMEFIELRRFQKEEIASWFRMPLYKLQDIGRAQGWSTLDAQETDYVSSCLMPWIVRFEQEIRRQLMQGYAPEIYPHCEFKGLLRGDVKTRQAFYVAMRQNGLLSGNDIRALEDIDPSDDPFMEEIFINSTMTTLERAASGAAPSGGPGAQAAPTPEETATEGA